MLAAASHNQCIHLHKVVITPLELCWLPLELGCCHPPKRGGLTHTLCYERGAHSAVREGVPCTHSAAREGVPCTHSAVREGVPCTHSAVREGVLCYQRGSPMHTLCCQRGSIYLSIYLSVCLSTLRHSPISDRYASLGESAWQLRLKK